jgi:hypothetical protein
MTQFPADPIPHPAQDGLSANRAVPPRHLLTRNPTITAHEHDHQRARSRRRFLRNVGAGVAMLATGARAAAAGLTATVRNPLLRAPLALLIDDSCPVINLGWHWIKTRHDWRLRLHPGTEASGWERLHDKLGTMESTVPADFAREWGEWCGEQGIRGKFSMVPFPAGVGRIDQNFPGHPERELREWLRVTREIIQPNFDLTPEVMTHTAVVDLKTWKLTDAWEQYEWMDPPVEPLTDYLAAAMQLLKNAGLACDGMTSPGAFGKKKEEAYARAVLDASMRVTGNTRPFYFVWVRAEENPETPLWHVDKAQGRAIASVMPGTGDWFGGSGYDPSEPDKFITEDLEHGRVPKLLQQELPTILLGHWPCFFANGAPGFKTLKIVKRRLDAFDPDRTRTLWMKTSDIGRYEMAKKLSDITITPGAKSDEADVSIVTKFPTTNFTLTLSREAKRLRLGGKDLCEVKSLRDFNRDSFLVKGGCTHLAFDLAEGTTALHATLA